MGKTRQEKLRYPILYDIYTENPAQTLIALMNMTSISHAMRRRQYCRKMNFLF
jgi:hypothetical protein